MDEEKIQGVSLQVSQGFPQTSDTLCGCLRGNGSLLRVSHILKVTLVSFTASKWQRCLPQTVKGSLILKATVNSTVLRWMKSTAKNLTGINDSPFSFLEGKTSHSCRQCIKHLEVISPIYRSYIISYMISEFVTNVNITKKRIPA